MATQSVGKLFCEFVADTSKFESGMATAGKSTDRFKQNLEQMKKQAQSADINKFVKESVSQQALSSSGLGGITDKLGSLATMSVTPMTLGVGAVAAGFGIAAMRMHEINNQIRDTGALAKSLGSTTEAASRLQKVGERYSVDTETIATGGRKLLNSAVEAVSGGGDRELFKQLGLDPTKMMAGGAAEALLQLSKAMDKLPTQAEKIHVAMKLMGRGGAELLPILDNLKGKMDAVSKSEIVTATNVQQMRAMKQAHIELMAELDKQFRGQAGAEVGAMTHLTRGFAYMVEILSGGGKKGVDDLFQKFSQADINIANADRDERRRQKQQALADSMGATAAAAKFADDAIGKLAEQLQRLRFGDRAAEAAEFRKQLLEKGMKSDAIDAQINKWNATMDKLEDAKKDVQRNDLAATVRTPEQKRDYAVSDLDRLYADKIEYEKDVAAAGFQVRTNYEDQYWALRRKYTQDYYKEVAGFDAKHLEQESKNAVDKYRERLDWLSKAQHDMDAASFKGGQAAKDKSFATAHRDTVEDLAKNLGLDTSVGEFNRQMAELQQALRETKLDPRLIQDKMTQLKESLLGIPDLRTIPEKLAATFSQLDRATDITDTERRQGKLMLAQKTMGNFQYGVEAAGRGSIEDYNLRTEFQGRGVQKEMLQQIADKTDELVRAVQSVDQNTKPLLNVAMAGSSGDFGGSTGGGSDF